MKLNEPCVLQVSSCVCVVCDVVCGVGFRLFLVEDLVDSLKFGVLLWCLTYVGACFNGITLIILGQYCYSLYT